MCGFNQMDSIDWPPKHKSQNAQNLCSLTVQENTAKEDDSVLPNQNLQNQIIQLKVEQQLIALLHHCSKKKDKINEAKVYSSDYRKQHESFLRSYSFIFPLNNDENYKISYVLIYYVKIDVIPCQIISFFVLISHPLQQLIYAYFTAYLQSTHCKNMKIIIQT